MTATTHLEVSDRLIDDRRFERDACGPIGGATFITLLSRAWQSGSKVFGIEYARQLCRGDEPAQVIDSLVEWGLLTRQGEHVSIVDAPELWRIV